MRGVLIALLFCCLMACTGSREDNPNLKLVVAVRGSSLNPNLSFNIVCNAQNQSFSAPGLLVAAVEALGASAAIGGSCALQSLAGQPYDLLNNAAGNAVYVSLPALGRVERYTPSADGLTLDTTFTLAAPSPFCPTRLALSPDETRLVALDDPSDTASGCDNTTPRAVRLGVFSASSGALLSNGVLGVAASDDRLRGPVAFALGNNVLIALEPFAGRYRLERYTLSDLTRLPLQSSDNITTGFAASGSSVDAALTGEGFVVSSGAFDGKSLTVGLQENSFEVVRFATEVQAVTQVNQLLPVGPTNRIVNTTLQGSSLTAYLRPNNLLLKRDAQASDAARVDSAVVGLSALDISFLPDGFTWALGTGVLQKLDTFNFPLISNAGSVSLGGANALALTWVVSP